MAVQTPEQIRALNPSELGFAELPIEFKLDFWMKPDERFPGIDPLVAAQLIFTHMLRLPPKVRVPLGLQCFSLAPLKNSRELDLTDPKHESYRFRIGFMRRSQLGWVELNRFEATEALERFGTGRFQDADDVTVDHLTVKFQPWAAERYGNLHQTLRKIEEDRDKLFRALDDASTSQEDTALNQQIDAAQNARCRVLLKLIEAAEVLEQRHGDKIPGKLLYRVVETRRGRAFLDFRLLEEDVDLLSRVLQEDLPIEDAESSIYFSQPPMVFENIEIPGTGTSGDKELDKQLAELIAARRELQAA